MIPTRVIPCLLLKGLGLVKTVKFKDPKYVGDPRNAVKLFNDLEVDELVLLDIEATKQGARPRFDLIQEIVSEAFMPLGYGGGVNNLEDARRLLQLGVEKVVVCSHAHADPDFVTRAADEFGSQSVVVCLDVKRNLFGKYEVFTHGGTKGTKRDPVTFAKELQAKGAGEIIVNSIDRDGTMAGYDLGLVRAVSDAVTVPVVACGGAGGVEDLGRAVREGGASAVSAGSMFVFHGKHRAVLINFPPLAERRRVFGE